MKRHNHVWSTYVEQTEWTTDGLYIGQRCECGADTAATPTVAAEVKRSLFVVWYASAGCLPDSDGPEFVGTLAECEQWVTDNADNYSRPDVSHDLYSLSIDAYDAGEDD